MEVWVISTGERYSKGDVWIIADCEGRMRGEVRACMASYNSSIGIEGWEEAEPSSQAFHHDYRKPVARYERSDHWIEVVKHFILD